MSAISVPPTGPEMKTLLLSLSVDVQQVALKRSGNHAGCYVAEFGKEGDQWVGKRPEGKWCSQEIDSVRTWVSRIKSALPGAVIVDTYESRSDYRPGNPVTAAMVIFRWSPQGEAQAARKKKARRPATQRAVA